MYKFSCFSKWAKYFLIRCNSPGSKPIPPTSPTFIFVKYRRDLLVYVRGFLPDLRYTFHSVLCPLILIYEQNFYLLQNFDIAYPYMKQNLFRANHPNPSNLYLCILKIAKQQTGMSTKFLPEEQYSSHSFPFFSPNEWTNPLACSKGRYTLL